jgi:hypothetical protein
MRLGEEGGFCSAGGFWARSAMPESKLKSRAASACNPNACSTVYSDMFYTWRELLLKKRSSPSFWIGLRESDAGNPPEVGPKTHEH